MLDFGWQEFMVIAVLTVIVVGPKELPRVFRTVTGLMRKARSLAGEFHSAMDEMAKEADLDDIKNEINKVKKGESDWVKNIDPTGEVDKSIKDMKSEMDQTRRDVNKASQLPQAPKKPIAGTAGGYVPPPKTETVKTEVAGPGTANPSDSKKPEPSVENNSPLPSSKSAAKKSSARKSTVKKAAAKKASAKKVSAKKASAKKAPAAKTTKGGDGA